MSTPGSGRAGQPSDDGAPGTRSDRRARPAASPAAAGVALGRPTVVVVVLLLLAAFLTLGSSAVRRKCATSDEVVHLLAGYAYWNLGDFRINPENGNLPQRWMALPLLRDKPGLPSFAAGPGADEWGLAQLFLYESGNDPARILAAGRGMMAIPAALLGLLVFAWSARLYGAAGGLLSLFLYSFSTVFLANAFLATSDLVASLFFLLSLGTLWRVLQRVDVRRLLAGGLAMGALFVTKMSAPLVVPMGVILAGLRLADGRDLEVRVGRASWRICGRGRQAAAMAGIALVYAVAVIATIWAFYGFRYDAIAPGLPGRERFDANWQAVLAGDYPLRGALIAAREHRLLPEAYVYGQAYVLQHSRRRWAFLDGRYSASGWWWFFPYCFATKTSPCVLVAIGLAAWAAWRRYPAPPGAGAGQRRRWEGFYRSAPLWVLLGVYWAAAVAASVNIGHRHILPTYAPLFVLCGGAVRCVESGRRSRSGGLLAVALAAYAAESAWMWPDYLAYFNVFAGGPKRGYRRLVDSSLDWGQDLPALREWLDAHGLNEAPPAPVYLSYFGTGSPTWHGIRAQRLAGYIDIDLHGSRNFAELRGGTYCVSASMLPMVLIEPRGPWSTFYEREYRQALEQFVQFRSLSTEEQQRELQARPTETGLLVARYDALRTGRLMAYLRRREPDDRVGYSILIYRLSDAEVEAALSGPPVELIAAEGPLRAE